MKQNKIHFTPEQISKIKSLVEDGYGERSVAKLIGSTRAPIKRIFKELGLNNSKRKRRISSLPSEKLCKACNSVKNINYFYKGYIKNNILYYRHFCMDCDSIRSAQYRVNNIDKIKIYEKQYRFENKKEISTKNNLYQKNRKRLIQFLN